MAHLVSNSLPKWWHLKPSACTPQVSLRALETLCQALLMEGLELCAES
jgi:hypothetical protein